MSRRPARQVDEMISARDVRRRAKRRGITEQQAYAELFNKFPAMPGDKSSLGLYVARRPAGGEAK